MDLDKLPILEKLAIVERFACAIAKNLDADTEVVRYIFNLSNRINGFVFSAAMRDLLAWHSNEKSLRDESMEGKYESG